MQTSTETIVFRRISLEPHEEFDVRLRGFPRWRVNMLEVTAAYITVYGGKGNNSRGSCVKFEHRFRDVDDLPGMPHHVAVEVRSAFNDLGPQQVTS